MFYLSCKQDSSGLVESSCPLLASVPVNVKPIVKYKYKSDLQVLLTMISVHIDKRPFLPFLGSSNNVVEGAVGESGDKGGVGAAEPNIIITGKSWIHVCLYVKGT